ncbi:hypothetical protein B9Z55_015882 [Caenorhabditis nigoni]|uniref:F-box domain-containing protein n=1 Tax=Caenorhabditis nigoni TaxID=1611254 RepID=A0A2G5UC62_9PELO|nr:hypothetical protein B9Z55_015882 [Caenorhabditis nigoni]
MPFPILRTPSVVLSEIISLLEPNEIVTASFCSKNVKHLLKRHYEQRKPLEWRLFMIDYKSWGRVDIKTSKDEEQITVLSADNLSELNEPIPISHASNGYITTFEYNCLTWFMKDQVLGTKMIVDYVRDLFSIDIFGVILDRNRTWAIDWVNNRQEKILHDFVWYKTAECNLDADEILDYVLRNARASNYCCIEASVSDNFKFDGKLGPMRELYIRSNGHWITLNNIINFDSIEIVVRESRISVSDLNLFLRHWRAGGSSRLKLLHLYFEKHTFQEKFDEDLEVVKTNEERVYRRSCDGAEMIVYGGYSIQRTDGVKALIQCDLREFILAVWACFFFGYCCLLKLPTEWEVGYRKNDDGSKETEGMRE